MPQKFRWSSYWYKRRTARLADEEVVAMTKEFVRTAVLDAIREDVVPQLTQCVRTCIASTYLQDDPHPFSPRRRERLDLL